MSSSPLPSLYELLGVDETATGDEIRVAYRKLVKRAHPDAGGTAAMFRLVEDAYATLSDPARRRRYDTERRTATSDTTASDTTASGGGDGRPGGPRHEPRDRNESPSASARMREQQQRGADAAWSRGRHAYQQAADDSKAREQAATAAAQLQRRVRRAERLTTLFGWIVPAAAVLLAAGVHHTARRWGWAGPVRSAALAELLEIFFRDRSTATASAFIVSTGCVVTGQHWRAWKLPSPWHAMVVAAAAATLVGTADRFPNTQAVIAAGVAAAVPAVLIAALRRRRTSRHADRLIRQHT